MNATETSKILALLKQAYPAFYKGQDSEEEALANINFWMAMFPEPYNLVENAVKALIATDVKGYPPHIGAVKTKIRQILKPFEMTEEEIAQEISAAAADGVYNADNRFLALSDGAKQIVGHPDRLRQWGMMDAVTFNSVVLSNLMRSYRDIRQQQQEYDALPADVKAFTNALAAKNKQEVIGDGQERLLAEKKDVES